MKYITVNIKDFLNKRFLFSLSIELEERCNYQLHSYTYPLLLGDLSMILWINISDEIEAQLNSEF